MRRLRHFRFWLLKTSPKCELLIQENVEGYCIFAPKVREGLGLTDDG
jgi:hypothetical protein